jgi:hypothetical protein
VEDVVARDLPLVMDCIKAKVRLEASKAKARREAQQRAEREAAVGKVKRVPGSPHG